ncbi:phosphatase [Azotosporobacter soli]|uniref:phosphatase n=1 Tax=Azotosporobacter soli TaxID=3055040 RepID=UPI0031FE5A0C
MQILVDLHTHTVSSGHAYSTIMENAQAAAKRGITMLAMTDHGPAMPGGPHEYHFGNQKVIPEYLSGVRILKGIEANVLDAAGKLDLPVGRLNKLDIVLAGLHTKCAPNQGCEANTAMLIAVMRNPLVDVIVHPGNPEYPVDIRAVVEAAKANDVALEINNSSLKQSRCGSRPLCLEFARLAYQSGTKLVLGTDSHFADAVGDFGEALVLLEEAGVPLDYVLNTMPERVLAHLARHRAPK